MPLSHDRLQQLAASGWRLTRDGSTATARYLVEDHDDPDNAWELLVLHTAGHGARLTLNVDGSALTERPLAEVRALDSTLTAAVELLEGWQGELPEE